MAERLPLVKLQPERILDWSGPLGGSTLLLRTAYRKARLLQVQPDDAPAATGETRRLWPMRRFARGGVETLALDSVGAGQSDLVWSNMALHAQAQPAAQFAAWHRALSPGGFLMFSTLGPGTLPEIRALYRDRAWGPPMADLIDMHDLGDALLGAGFSDPVMDQETLTLSWADAEGLLAELRSWGANLSPQRRTGLCGRHWRGELCRELSSRSSHGRPVLSVELVYGHAFRESTPPGRTGEVRIPLAEVRGRLHRVGRSKA